MDLWTGDVRPCELDADRDELLAANPAFAAFLGTPGGAVVVQVELGVLERCLFCFKRLHT